MGLHSNFTYLWNMCKGLKTRAEYIPTHVEDPCKISSNQRNSAKRAITWLLSKSPHSVEEIADHFELSPQLVGSLMEELVYANYVTRESLRSDRYELNKSTKEAGEVS